MEKMGYEMGGGGGVGVVRWARGRARQEAASQRLSLESLIVSLSSPLVSSSTRVTEGLWILPADLPKSR